MKKRKCRMTKEETSIHEEAVKLRKMTDHQLVTAFRLAGDREMPLRKQEVAQGDTKKTGAKKNTPEVKMLLDAISEGKIKGVGGATSYKIAEYAREMGLIV